MEEEIFFKRLREKAQKVSKTWTADYSDFIYRDRLGDLEAVFSHLELYWKVWGGYPDAERVQVFMGMMEMDVEPPFAEQALICLRGPEKFITADHRDYLGALMSLGIKRERFGDLIVREDGCDIIVSETVAPLILQSDLKIRRVRMKAKRGDFNLWDAPVPDYKVIAAQLVSLRLDGIIAKGFNLSRSTAATLIQKEMVQINHKISTKSAANCVAGDVISVRGHGKLKVGEVDGLTKKGKYRLNLYKYQ